MTTKSVIPGLIYPDESVFNDKITRFIQAGSSSLHLVFDFDRTLTVSAPETNEDITTWHILGKHLPDVGKQEYAALFAKYRPVELSEDLTKTAAVQWWEDTLQLLVRYRVNLFDVEKEFMQLATIRPGTVELFHLCNISNIPAVILSAGVRDVIDLWGKVYNVKPSLVLSTALIIDRSGVVVGWDHDTLIHVLNKHETEHTELTNIRRTRSNSIIVGDSMNDADMASGDDNVLRIRVFDPRDDETINTLEVRRRTFERFDAMLELASLAPVERLVQLIIHGSA